MFPCAQYYHRCKQQNLSKTWQIISKHSAAVLDILCGAQVVVHIAHHSSAQILTDVSGAGFVVFARFQLFLIYKSYFKQIWNVPLICLDVSV